MKIIYVNPETQEIELVKKVKGGFHLKKVEGDKYITKNYKDLLTLITTEIGIKNLFENGILASNFNDEVIKCLIESGRFTIFEYGKWKYITIRPIQSLIEIAKEKVIQNKYYKDFYIIGGDKETNKRMKMRIEKDDSVLFIDPTFLEIDIDRKFIALEFTPFYFDGDSYLPMDGIGGIEIKLSELKEAHKDLFDYFNEVISKAKSMHDDSKEVQLYILEEDLKKQYEKTDEAFDITEGYLFFEVITRRGESDYFVI
jgi:hypothetical protein